MKNLKISHVSILMSLLFFFSFIQTAWPENGRITFILGKAVIERNGKEINVSLGISVNENDILMTRSKSTVIITLNNSSQLKLRENSTLKMDRLRYKQMNFKLWAGSLFTRVSKLSKNQKFNIESPTAVVGVRGTEFFTAYGKRKNDQPDLRLCVNEGQVEVKSKITKKKVIVEEGKGIFIKKGVHITEPKEYDWTKKLNWNMNPEEGGVIDNTSLEDAYSDLLDQDYD